uniref:Uncharacterized protein n=1 Tax=Anguilla anguilla TaxID=7936 RepID=A0A0E9VEH9_ANGAN
MLHCLKGLKHFSIAICNYSLSSVGKLCPCERMKLSFGKVVFCSSPQFHVL